MYLERVGFMGGKDQAKKGPKLEGDASGPVNCGSQGCTKKSWRFGFCEEHYEQYKFGLINKKGQKVPDYDKKFEHYLRLKEKRVAQKVA